MRKIAALIAIPMQFTGLTRTDTLIFCTARTKRPFGAKEYERTAAFTDPMWPSMTLFILLLLSPCSLPYAYGAASQSPGERVSALAASIVADQGMIHPANDPDNLAADAGEESTDDEVGPPSRLASRLNWKKHASQPLIGHALVLA
jgi:hypothetical protein